MVPDDLPPATRTQPAQAIRANRPSYLDYRPPPRHGQAKQAILTIFYNSDLVALTVPK